MKDTKKLNMNELDQVNGGLAVDGGIEIERLPLEQIRGIAQDTMPQDVPEELIRQLSQRHPGLTDEYSRRIHPVKIISVERHEDRQSKF